MASQIGTWAHEIARAWLVLELMGKATALGTLMLAAAIPGLIFSFQGGLVADRTNVRRLLMYTKFASALVALATGFVVEFTHVQLWHLVVFAALEGAIGAFDIPAYQAVAVRLIPRNEFQRALAIMSTNFHLSRALGPLIAGLLLAISGPSMVFFLDGITYFILIALLSRVKMRPLPRNHASSPTKGLKAIFDGIHYCWTNLPIRFVILQFTLAVSILYPVSLVVFRTFLREKFALEGDEFSYLFAAPSAGAMAGALYFIAAQLKKPINNLRFSVPAIVVLYCSLPLAANVYWAAGILVVVGFCNYLNFASCTHTIHLTVQEEYRGRTSAILSLGFISIGPLMSFPVGYISDSIGFETTIYLFSILFAFGSALLLVSQRLAFSRQEAPVEPRHSSSLRSHTEPSVDEVRRHTTDLRGERPL